ncbi:Uncharacterised protein [Mycobacteroides abscessus subsp. abscessus]|nr:Uncharacterised protein [Mycobacteroides abscessus subsp. abscessus]
MPPKARFFTGMINSSSTMQIGTAILSGCRITHWVVLPQKPFSTSSAVLVLRKRLRPSMSTRGPSTPSMAGRMVIAVSAARVTVAMVP